MATIETKPLPPPNSSATTIAEADRAEMMAHANAVIDYYLNGPGSYWDAGTRKPLASDDEFRDADTTVNDLRKFRDRVIAAKQFADDPGLIMASVIDLINQTMRQIDEAARYSEGKTSIVHPPPDTNEPIDDPRVISPRALNNAALPIMFEEGRSSPLHAGETSEVSTGSPVRILSRRTPSTSDLGGVMAPDFGEMATRRPDAQNIGVLSGSVMPRGDARNGNSSTLGIPNPLVSRPQPDPTLALVAAKPMSQRIIPPSIFDFSDRSATSGSDVADWPAILVGLSKGSSKLPPSVSDAGVPAAPSVSFNEYRSPDRRTSLGGASDPFSPDPPGGLAGRLAALAGIDPANPDPWVQTLPKNGFDNDGLPQPWLFRALTGRLR